MVAQQCPLSTGAETTPKPTSTAQSRAQGQRDVEAAPIAGCNQLKQRQPMENLCAQHSDSEAPTTQPQTMNTVYIYTSSRPECEPVEAAVMSAMA